jgi:hypothetical protein
MSVPALRQLNTSLLCACCSIARISRLAVQHSLARMPLAPVPQSLSPSVPQSLENGTELPTLSGQQIFGARRMLLVESPLDQAGPLECLQSRGERIRARPRKRLFKIEEFFDNARVQHVIRKPGVRPSAGIDFPRDFVSECGREETDPYRRRTATYAQFTRKTSNARLSLPDALCTRSVYSVYRRQSPRLILTALTDGLPRRRWLTPRKITEPWG